MTFSDNGKYCDIIYDNDMTIDGATIVQEPIVQGDNCPRDSCPRGNCPRRLLSKETIVQADFFLRRQLHYLLSKEEG